MVHSIWKKIWASEQLRLFFKVLCFLKHANIWPKVKERHKNNLYNHLVRFHIHWLGIFPSCCFLPTDLIEKFVFNHLGHQAVDCLYRSLGAEMWGKKRKFSMETCAFVHWRQCYNGHVNTQPAPRTKLNSGQVRLRSCAEILVLGLHLCTRIWLRAMIGLFKKAIVELPIRLKGNTRRPSGNSLSLLAAHNKDFGSASQKLPTKL